MAARDEEKRNIPRLGAAPFTYAELRTLANKPWNRSIDDFTIALNLTWNQMAKIQKTARALLRQRTGHRGDKETDLYKRGQELLVWMEERPGGASIDCLHLGIYEQLMAKVPQFQEPYKRDASGQLILLHGAPQKDLAQMNAREQDDPCGLVTVEKIAKPTFDMVRVYAMAIVHLEMARMKRHPLLRRAATETQFRWRCNLRVEDVLDATGPTAGWKKRKRGDIQLRYDKRNITLYNFESREREAECHVTPDLSAMLPRRWPQQYDRDEDFPLLELVDEKLWQEVAKLMGVEDWRELRRSGWLRYVYVPPEVEEECSGILPYDLGMMEGVKVWNVKNGAQLGRMVQIHCEELPGMARDTVFSLDYIKGVPDGEVELEKFT